MPVNYDEMLIGRIQNKDFNKLGEEIDSVLGKKITERILVKKTEVLDRMNNKVKE